MTASLDHVIVAASDLRQGCDFIEAKLGARPVASGSHPEIGTQNTIVAFNDSTYLEVLAPTSALKPETGIAESLQKVKTPGIWHWAVAARNLDEVDAVLIGASVETSGIVPCSRVQPDGTEIHWNLLIPTCPEFGAALPFFIDWRSAVHPTDNTEKMQRSPRLKISHPRASALNRVYSALGIDFIAHSCAEPGLVFSVSGLRPVFSINPFCPGLGVVGSS